MASYRHDCLIPVGSLVSTNAAYFDANYADQAHHIQGAGYAEASLTPASECWFHFVLEGDTNPTTAWDNTWIDIYDDVSGGENRIFRATSVNGTTTFYWMHSGGSTALTPTYALPNANVSVTYDIQIIVHATTGRIRVYKDNVILVDSGDMDTVGDDTGRLVEKIRVRSAAQGQTTTDFYFSEFFIGEDSASDTRGLRMWTREFTANGTNTAWSGDYTDIDDGYITNAEIISSDTGTERETYTYPALPVTLANNAILEVAVSSIGFRTGGPSDYKHSLRVGGTDYDGAALSVGTIQDWYQTRWVNNPDTGSLWKVTEFDGSEAGVVSVT